jgi:NCS1 family nucleobase:cation symporter-1
MNALIEDVSASIVHDGLSSDRQTMTLEKVFWAHFCTNMLPATWVLGALLVVTGLDFKTGLLAIVVGNLIGCTLVAANSSIGPKTGLTQMETSRFAFGFIGKRMCAALNWTGSVAWDAVANVPAALALVALFAIYHAGLPFWGGLAMLVAVQLAASYYGHHVVQLVAKYLCYVLIVLFSVTAVVAILKGGALATAHAAVTPAMIVFGIGMTAGATISFAPCGADYTRYLPRTTKTSTVFWLAFSGLAISTVLLELCGLLTANRLTDLSTNGIIKGFADLTGPFAPVAFIALALATIPPNAINDNTGGYCLISAGLRIPRHFAAIFTTLCGFVIALVGAAKFADLFSNYLVLSLYWIGPWCGMMIVDFVLHRGATHRVRQWSTGATIFVVIVPVTFYLFSASELYTGPIAKMIGGIDIGYAVGFVIASVTYAIVERPRGAESTLTLLPAGEPAE